MCPCHPDPSLHPHGTAPRRRFLTAAASFSALLAAPSSSWALTDVDQPAPPSVTPDEALARLIEGNRRFVDDKAKGPPPDLSRNRRLEIAKAQRPFAVLVGCSDSRVAPELLFGRGLGELFIVRNAGNCIDTAAMGSIEYAIAELKVPLVVVLGHKRCGAVAAAVAVVQSNARFPGSIGAMVEPIIPAVLAAKAKVGNGGDLLDASVHENVARVAGRLRDASPVVVGPLREKRLKIVGADYDLDDGSVDFFDRG